MLPQLDDLSDLYSDRDPAVIKQDYDKFDKLPAWMRAILREDLPLDMSAAGSLDLWRKEYIPGEERNFKKEMVNIAIDFYNDEQEEHERKFEGYTPIYIDTYVPLKVMKGMYTDRRGIVERAIRKSQAQRLP